MHVLFEDDGQLKAGTVLADHDQSLQVEAVSGKRLKIKAASVLLRFASPGPAEALGDAQRLTAELDANFLWEAVGDGEFGFDDLAREYYGASPTPAQAAAVALLLASSPMHFYRKGKGRYRKAPPDALKAALASVERKRQEATRTDEWVAALARCELPEALRAKLSMLLYKPDKNTLEWKALARACDATRKSLVGLLADCGAIPSTSITLIVSSRRHSPRALRFRLKFQVRPYPICRLRTCARSRSMTRRRPKSMTRSP